MSETHRKEYLSRIHRAQDFIEQNLTSGLTLEQIARAACYSPFHFHRVFAAITGETLYQFILRLRLERAAVRLRQNDGATITEIALGMGFSSSSTFARSFQAHFGVSASEFRKICKAKRKGRQAGEDPAPYGAVQAITPLARGTSMHPETTTQPLGLEIRDLEAITVAYLRHVGPYVGDSTLFQRLFGELFRWAGPRGLVPSPTARLLTVAHDNPHITVPDKLRLSVGLTVPAGTETSPPVALMTLPAGRYACARFELLPSEFPAAWNHVCGEWLPGSGYQLGELPCYEIYLDEARKNEEGRMNVEIRVGVIPL
jgi:AraC family transcriptional regulator